VDLNERQRVGEDPEEYVTRLAQEKAEAALAGAHTADVVLGADTIVVHNGTVLGKPANEVEAEEILMELKGREHTVITAIALIDPANHRLKIDHCVTQVPMREYSLTEVENYVASGDPLDKAGAYAIQNSNFANVMGLPLCHLLRSMREWDLDTAIDIPAACIRHTRYDCGVYSAILDHSL
jgi:septum formation protein